MTNLSEYNNDGASYQSKAVLAFLQVMTIEESWNKEYHKYDAEPLVSRWENCREQGYVIVLRHLFPNNEYKQLNIAFFEHRNVDNLCAVKWEQVTINAPTIDNAKFGNIYKDKYDTSFDVSYGEIDKMAEWIKKELINFWVINNSKTKKIKSHV